MSIKKLHLGETKKMLFHFTHMYLILPSLFFFSCITEICLSVHRVIFLPAWEFIATSLVSSVVERKRAEREKTLSSNELAYTGSGSPDRIDICCGPSLIPLVLIFIPLVLIFSAFVYFSSFFLKDPVQLPQPMVEATGLGHRQASEGCSARELCHPVTTN